MTTVKQSEMTVKTYDFSRDMKSANGWPVPQPLPSGLLPVAEFQSDFLPVSIGPWVGDITERMQCPPDFVGISAMVALGSVLGCKIGILPMQNNDWIEVPNLWGLAVGRPGLLKSPSIGQALAPLKRLEADARKNHKEEMAKHEKDYEIYKIKKKAMEDVIKKAVQQGHEPPPMPEEPEKPVCRRYIVNDATYESLGEILVGNPQGVLSHRDEMMTLLRTLEREDNAAARGFYLTAWDGQSGYTFDRIIRGKQHIESACLSMLGSCQPGRIAEYLRRAINGGEGDDGMIQRFSLMVWPDQNPNWEEVDRYPDTEKRTTAWETFRYLDSLKPESIGAVLDGYRTIPCIKFNIKAQEIFSEWRKNLETLLRSKTIHPALESHLAKYRKMVPTLALINHLAARGQGAVTEDAVKRAITFASYLETHARRAYGSGIAAEADVAKAVLARIRKGDLKDGFSARDVYRNQWSNLSNVEQVQAGLNLLVDCNWLVEREDSQKVVGKAKVNYRISPSAFGAQTYH